MRETDVAEVINTPGSKRLTESSTRGTDVAEEINTPGNEESTASPGRGADNTAEIIPLRVSNLQQVLVQETRKLG